MLQVPVMYYLYANQDKSRHLPSLDVEFNGVNAALMPLKKYGLLQMEVSPQSGTHDVVEVVKHLNARIAIVHFSGHSGPDALELDQKTPAGAAGLKSVFQSCKGLKLVFLNGCSNRDLVEWLFEAGAKAVIATSSDVFDEQAAKLSRAFYESWSIEGNTLKSAFDFAVGFASQAGNTLVKREMRKSLSPTDPMPWAIYTNDDETVLDWQLFPKDAQKILPPDPTVAADLEALEKLRKKITIREKRVTEALDDDEKALAIEDLERDLKERDAVVARLQGIERQIKLREGVFRLNYHEQMAGFDAELDELVVSFVIRATAHDGAGILAQRFLKSNLANHKEANIVIPMDLRAFSTSGGYGWMLQQLAVHLRTEATIVAIAAELERLLTDTNPRLVVFLFNNSGHLLPDMMTDLLQNFWLALAKNLKAKPLKRKMFALWIDRGDRDGFPSLPYDQLLPEQEQANLAFFVLKPITQLSAEDFFKWCYDYATELGDVRLQWQDIHTKTGGRLKPMMSEVFSRSGLNNLTIEYDGWDNLNPINL